MAMMKLAGSTSPQTGQQRGRTLPAQNGLRIRLPTVPHMAVSTLKIEMTYPALT